MPLTTNSSVVRWAMPLAAPLYVVRWAMPLTTPISVVRWAMPLTANNVARWAMPLTTSIIPPFKFYYPALCWPVLHQDSQLQSQRTRPLDKPLNTNLPNHP